MARNGNFWSAFGAGAAVGAGAVLLPQLVGKAGASRIIRLEKSIQIGRPSDEVFNAWVHWERLSSASDNICEIRNHRDHSHWRVKVADSTIEWKARTEQFVQNQAIGWKSVSGPKHTGRITFAPIGNDTVVHITMNYVPPMRFMRPLMSTLTGHMEGLIEKVLREFKASVESGSVRTGVREPGPALQMPATGTFGAEPRAVDSRFGGMDNPLNTPSELKR